MDKLYQKSWDKLYLKDKLDPFETILSIIQI